MSPDRLSFLGDADHIIIIVNSLCRNKIHLVAKSVDHLSHGASAVSVEQLEVNLLALSGVGDKDYGLVFLNLHQADDLIAFRKIHASYAVRGSSHDPDVINGEPESLSVSGHNHGLIALPDEQALDQCIAFIKDNRLDSVLSGVDEVIEPDLLYNTESGCHENALGFIEILEVNDC